MSFIKALAAIVVLFFLLCLGGYAYMGGFAPVKIERSVYGPVEIAYATYRGPYRNLGGEWDRFQSAWEQAGLTGCNALSLYFDPPGTPEENLRSVIACRIDELTGETKEKWRAAFPVFVIPESEALVSSFPYKNEASYFFAPMKVYPAIAKTYRAETEDAVVGIETYGDMTSVEEIGFIIPLDLDETVFTPIFEAF